MNKHIKRIIQATFVCIGMLFLLPTHTLAQNDPAVDRSVAIVWNSDGSKVAVGYLHGRIEIWDTTTKTLITTLLGHASSVEAIAWSPEGDRLISGSFDYTVRIWDIETGESSLFPDVTQSIGGVGWSPDGNYAIISQNRGDNNLSVMDMNTNQVVHTETASGVSAFLWSPDQRFVGISYSIPTISIRDTQTWQEIKYIGANPHIPYGASHGEQLMTFAWSPNSQYIVTGAFLRFVTLWDVETGEELFSVKATDNENRDDVFSMIVRAVWFNPDGSEFNSLAGDGTYRRWSTSTGELIASTQWLETPVFAANLSPYGGRLAFAGHPSENASATGQEHGQAFADGAVHVVVPNPSRELLESVRGQCVAAMRRPADLPELPEQAKIPAFVRQVRGLQERGAVPPGCAADLIAVAEALQGQ